MIGRGLLLSKVELLATLPITTGAGLGTEVGSKCSADSLNSRLSRVSS